MVDQTTNHPRILIVDDDDGTREALEVILEDDYEVASVADGRIALDKLNDEDFDLVLLDVMMPDMDGIETLKRIKAYDKQIDVIMVSATDRAREATAAITSGAYDYITKPFDAEAILTAIERALQKRSLEQEVRYLRSEVALRYDETKIIGQSQPMKAVFSLIDKVAGTSSNVLITGESGTGKELAARAIHNQSPRVSRPFVAINCAAIPPELIESELFGHEKGAFTGATGRKPGKFELAQDGTLFLDEIGELALPPQAKLLRVLQEQVFERVGGTQQVGSNARVIAATNRDLFAEAAAGHFREDLAYRLKVISIHLPALRQRLEDIPLLAKALIEKISRKIHKPPLQLTDSALGLLQSHDWPGNVRELENLLTQALVQARGNALTPDLLPLRPSASASSLPAVETAAQAAKSLDQVEAEHIQLVLDATSGHKGKSCEILGISRPALDRKIKKFALSLTKNR